MDDAITRICHAVVPVTEQDQLPDPNEETTHNSGTHNCPVHTPSPADQPGTDTDSKAGTPTDPPTDLDADLDADLDRRMERLREASLNQVRQKADEKKNI